MPETWRINKFAMGNYSKSKQPETILNQSKLPRNHLKPPRNQSNSSKITQEHLNPIHILPKLTMTSQKLPNTSPIRASSHQSIPWFSAVDFEHEFIVWKVRLGKGDENIAIIMHRIGKLGTLSHISERLL